MLLLGLLVLHFALMVSDLSGLPWFINVSESQGPGTVLQPFSFNCSSSTASLELLSVQPPTTFFNPPSLTRWQGSYVGKVTLSSSARLDALEVNHYELQLQFTCGNQVTRGPLSVDVQRDPSRIRCAGRFASPAGETIQVLETVTPGARLYTLLLPGLELQGAQMSIISAQDPPHFPGPFSINQQGWLRAPPQGLKGQAQKVFQLRISVSLRQGQSCQGMVTVKVLPSPSSQVSFLQQAQNITIPDNLDPGREVFHVQARGSDVRYEILSPVPSPFYSIGLADGVIRTTASLELARAPDAAVTRLQVKAFERLQPWAGAELHLTVIVQAANHWPPRCFPALLVTQIPETAPVGMVLRTLDCTDPDAADTILNYQLWFHSSLSPASLRLRDSALEVNATLDCDAPGACMQLAASILVLDGGQPQMTSECPCPGQGFPIPHFPSAKQFLSLFRNQWGRILSSADRRGILDSSWGGLSSPVSLQTISLLRPPGQGWASQARFLTVRWPPAEVPVLVMVTPVNEFSPACVPQTFRVREDAGPHTLLGSVVGTDLDYPHNSIEYYVSGGPATFAVDRLSGEVQLLGPLDYEQQRLYRLVVLLIDQGQDQDPTYQRSGSCTITIEVEDVNDQAPECEPPFQELTIYPPPGRSVEVTKMSCQIPQEPQRLAFSYSIVRGNSQRRFSLQGAVLMHSGPVLGLLWPEQPRTYELLIRVADTGPSSPHLSTTATIIVHLVPWRASTVATSTHRATVRVSSTMTPLLVTSTEVVWQPEPWFVVVLTATGVLVLLALSWPLSKLTQGLTQVLQAPSKPAQALWLNSIQGADGSFEGFMEAPRMELPQAPNGIMSLHFDGRAQDSSQTLLHGGPQLNSGFPATTKHLPPAFS